MYLRIIGILLLLAVSELLEAQVITVVNNRNQLPVSEVLIYDSLSERTVLTNDLGQADISLLAATKLYFRHPSFQVLSIAKDDISNVVMLKEKVIHTEQVVISANKWEQEISEVPQEIVAIEREQIRFRNPATAADILAQSGEIFVQKSQLGGGSPSLRGFAANAVLLVFDGVRMNNAIFRSGNLQNVISIDPFVLEGVEVLMGTGSVIYGSDALGGVLDFHSVTPGFTNGDSLVVRPEALVRYASASHEKTVHGSLRVSNKSWSSFTSFSYTDFDDLRTGRELDNDYPDYGKYPFNVGQTTDGEDFVRTSDDHLMEPTAYHTLSLMQKIRHSPSPTSDYLYSFYHNQTGDIPRFDRLIETEEGLPVYAEWYYGPQVWTMHSLRATFSAPTDWYDQSRIIGAYQRYKESRYDRRYDSPLRRAQEESLHIGTLTVDFEKSLQNQTDLYFGLDLLRNWVDSRASRQNIFTNERSEAASRYPDGGSTYSSMAGYLSLTHLLSDKATLTGGLRYTHVWLHAETQDEDALQLGSREANLSNGSVNGNAGITYQLSPAHRISALVSSGFRAPNVDDVGKVFELDGDDLIIPNDNLRPETTYNGELSWGYSQSKLTLDATIFYSYLDNAIVRGRTTIGGRDSLFYSGSYKDLYSQVNAASAHIYGTSLQAAYSISNEFGISGTLNYTTGEENNGEPLRHTTPLFGSLNLTWIHKTLKLEAYADFNGNRFREDIPSSEIDSKPYQYAIHKSDPGLDGSPGWYTLNLRTSWQINSSLLIQGSVENILDRHYRMYSSGISAPGRNMILSLRYSPF